MPWLVAAHQAPVLPLKRRWPGIFSGLALVLGTLAPDLTFILRLDPRGTPASHTLLGQLYLTVPIVLALHALLTALVLPWLLPHLPGGPPLHLHALARCGPATDGLGLARVALSGLVGGLTHVFLDGFTHAGDSGWALVYLPWLATIVPYPAGGTAPLYESLQVWLTLGLGILALRQWNDLARRPPPHGGAAGVAVQPAPRGGRSGRACSPPGWRERLWGPCCAEPWESPRP
jgi:Domain of unknown function (DUF4184)